jgi:mevalonate kinase
MPAISVSAPGKIILFGEHAVVYGYPAIAAPVTQVKAKVIISANPLAVPGKINLQAPNIGLDADLDELASDHPLVTAIQAVAQFLGVRRLPACSIRITSSIPVAAGMGSGAAVSIALIRALSAFLGKPLDHENVSSLAFQVEKLYHGTPSGIDNTVITYEQPVYFVRGHPILNLNVSKSFTVVIGDTGISCPTAVTVGDLADAWRSDPEPIKQAFDQIARITDAARQAIESGNPTELGPLMSANHQRLQTLGVSSPELDRLVEAARSAGASGAKLSGGGRGGNMIALVESNRAQSVADALQNAGAVRAIITEIKQQERR